MCMQAILCFRQSIKLIYSWWSFNKHDAVFNLFSVSSFSSTLYLAQWDIPVKRKIQKTIRKWHFFWSLAFSDGFFGFFSSLVCPIELILFSLHLYFSPDRFRHPYIGFTTTFFFGPIMGKSKSNMAGWGPEFANGPLWRVDTSSMMTITWENAWKTKLCEKIPPLIWMLLSGKLSMIYCSIMIIAHSVTLKLKMLGLELQGCSWT